MSASWPWSKTFTTFGCASRGRRTRLLHEPRLERVVVGEVPVHDLDRDAALEAQVGREVHGGHAPAGDPRAHLIPAVDRDGRSSGRRARWSRFESTKCVVCPQPTKRRATAGSQRLRDADAAGGRGGPTAQPSSRQPGSRLRLPLRVVVGVRASAAPPAPPASRSSTPTRRCRAGPRVRPGFGLAAPP